MNQDFVRSRHSHLLDEDPNELYENAPCGYLSTLPDGTIIKVNATFLEWTGYSCGDLLGKKRFQELLPVAGRVFYDTHFGPLLIMQGYAKELAFEIVCCNGKRMAILLNSALKRDARGNPQVIRITLLDARGRRAYEEELRLAKRKAENAEALLKQLNDSLEQRIAERTQERDRIWRMSQDMLVVASIHGNLISFNPAFTRILGWTEQDMQEISLAGLLYPEDLPEFVEVVARMSAGEAAARFEARGRHKDGSSRWISWIIVPEGEMLYAVGRDVSEERKQAQALREIESALHQAQKMEAIGKLTGGVAHDFNNILQVIAGNLELLKLNVPYSTEAQNRLKMAVAAVDRGANLASQLLSFARRQPLQPLPTNLGRVLRDMDGMLRRVLGESVEVETVVGGGLWTAMVDRNQLENVILNLAINARDAMKGEGKLTLELGNASLDQQYADAHAEIQPGQYVMLAVSDTGCGMSPEVMARAFEPFFTTKPEGEGTGLGLSMVYGFVKQSGGHVKAYSEQGIGTTFKIYLPRVQQAAVTIPVVEHREVTGGRETILVVEDDPSVQATVVDMLTSLGYQVLKAGDSESALTILQSGMQIDMLFTDVVMPGPVRSTDLARQAQKLFPDIEVLFTSGYTQNAIVHGGRLDPGVELISKPYRREELASKIRKMLANKKPASAQPVPPQHNASRTAAPVAATRHRILVVEDDPDTKLTVCELLSLLGHSVQGVMSGEEALAALSGGGFNVLLTDVSLPGMSGIRLAQKALQSYPGLTVILASGYGALEDLGFKPLLLPKPYTLQQVEEVLARVA